MTSKKFSNIPVTNGTATTTFTPTAEEVGTYNLTAKYIQNDTYRETISIPVNLTITDSSPPYIISVYLTSHGTVTNQAYYRDTLQLCFEIKDKNGTPIPDETVHFKLKPESSNDYIDYSRNSFNGLVQINVPLPAGTHGYYLKYTDPNDSTRYSEVEGTFTILPHDVTITPASSYVHTGTNDVTLTGTVTSNVNNSNATGVISIIRNGNVLATANVNGSYSLNFNVASYYDTYTLQFVDSSGNYNTASTDITIEFYPE